jgi:hypothetical protein
MPSGKRYRASTVIRAGLAKPASSLSGSSRLEPVRPPHRQDLEQQQDAEDTEGGDLDRGLPERIGDQRADDDRHRQGHWQSVTHLADFDHRICPTIRRLMRAP